MVCIQGAGRGTDIQLDGDDGDHEPRGRARTPGWSPTPTLAVLMAELPVRDERCRTAVLVSSGMAGRPSGGRRWSSGR
jgi:hypothetical protein